MPGKGKLIRRDDGAYDIFLNDVACWRNVPETVWDYTIGGYQVIKKWLSYREKPLLGRGLTPDEVRYVTEMARRLIGSDCLADILGRQLPERDPDDLSVDEPIGIAGDLKMDCVYNKSIKNFVRSLNGEVKKANFRTINRILFSHYPHGDSD